MTNLYTSWFNTKDTLKHEEMLECIENNSNNKYIDKIYMLNETEFKFDNPKIINIELYDQRPTYNLFFKIINRKTPNDINIISNTDIYLMILSRNIKIEL